MLAIIAVILVKAAVSQVTIFSDRALVVRAGEAAVEGRAQLELPLLPETVDPASIRLDAKGAEVLQFDVQRVEPDEFPAGEAVALLAQLEEIDDQLFLLDAETTQLQQHLESIHGVAPEERDEPLKPAPKLNPQRWAETIAFVRDEEAAVRQRISQNTAHSGELQRQRQPLAVRALQLGGVEPKPGWRVVATVEGHGVARLSLSYLVARARWVPGYDLQLLDDQKTVRISFSGSASQESGEDWDAAAMTLSTAIPATLRSLPGLTTWKIGEAERFVPQSHAVRTPRAPSALPQVAREPSPVESAPLREALIARAGGQPAVEVSRVQRKKSYAPPPPARVANAPTPSAFAEAPAAASPEALSSARGYATEEIAVTGSRVRHKDVEGQPSEPPRPLENVGIAPPPSWTPPPPPPDSAAALAGGHDLTFTSPRRETLRSGAGARRVLLFTETWPVATERLLVPAVSPDAVLVAQIRNPGQRTLPAGQASLNIGDEPSGTAPLTLIAPGAEVILPLGLDHAIKTFRNVAQVKSEKGLFNKDDVTRYSVTIEVQNPYAVPVALRIVDQLPLPGSDHVSVEPIDLQNAERDAKTGALTWRLTAPPSGTLKAGFTYDLKRPHGWEVHQ